MKKEKQKKLSLCLIAVVIMAAVMLPFSALAAENSGIDVTADDYADGEGYTWDEATNTLTLTDVTLTGDGTGVGDCTSLMVKSPLFLLETAPYKTSARVFPRRTPVLPREIHFLLPVQAHLQ